MKKITIAFTCKNIDEVKENMEKLSGLMLKKVIVPAGMNNHLVIIYKYDELSVVHISSMQRKNAYTEENSIEDFITSIKQIQNEHQKGK